jgi:hypothetical protein
MKNLISQSDEALESKPIKEPFRPRIPGFWIGEYRSHYPYSRLQRWLKSQVGKPWAEVTSKYVKLAWIPKQYRTYSFLADNVDLTVFMRDYEVFFIGLYGAVRVSDRDGRFYVHPQKITLEYTDKKKKQNWTKIHKAQQDKVCKIIDNYTQLLLIHGIWYLVTITQDKIDYYERFYGTKWKKNRPFIEVINYIAGLPGNFRCIKQLNKRELVKYGLKNL